MGKSISKGFRSIAKGLTGGNDAQVVPQAPAPAAEAPVDSQSPVVETQGQEPEAKTIARGKSGLNISKTSGGGLSI